MELKNEQDHLGSVRRWITDFLKKEETEIALLEERTGTEYKKAGGTYSQEYENVFFNLSVMKKRREEFTEAYGKPYFGRIDFRARTQAEKETLYIGKHSVVDPDTADYLVTDWRAPISDLYYSGTLGRSEYKAPGGFIEGDFSLKRRFTYTKDELPLIDRYFDEGDSIITPQSEGEGNVLDDEFLRINLEESSGEKLKEIVATIAKEQNEIIRAEKNIPIILQGAAGAGKTTVALHRLSYLLYKHRDTLTDMDVCIIAPNRLFLEYISEVLPDLGSNGVIQTTFEDLVLKETGLKKYNLTRDEILKSVLEGDEAGILLSKVSGIKGSYSFTEVIRAMADDYRDSIIPDTGIEASGEILYTSDELRKLFSESLSHLNITERLKMLESYTKKNLKERREKAAVSLTSSYDRKVRVIKNIYEGSEKEKRAKIIEVYDERDRIIKELPSESSKALKSWFKSCRMKKIPELYSHYIMDTEFMEKALADAGIETSPEEFKMITGSEKDKITGDDLGPIMYLKILTEGPGKIFSHIVVDEAQDYSPIEAEVIRNLSRQDSVTMVGDLAQGIYSYKGIRQWSDLSPVFRGNESFRQLKQSYRSTVEIIEEANITLKKMDKNIKEAVPVLRHGKKPERIEYRDGELPGIIRKIEETMAKEGRNTLALVTRAEGEAMEVHKILKKDFPEMVLSVGKNSDIHAKSLKRIIMPSYMTKGLEFDCVVLIDEDLFSDSDLDLSLKYVSLTRALHLEYILKKKQ